MAFGFSVIPEVCFMYICDFCGQTSKTDPCRFCKSPVKSQNILSAAGPTIVIHEKKKVHNWIERMDFYIDILAPILKKSSLVVDIGCGPNEFVRCAEKKFPNIKGFGFDKFSRGVSTVKELDFEINRLPFEDDTVDLVVLSHVLEHLERLHFVLNEALRISKHVFVALPNQLNIFRLLRYGSGSTASCALGLPLIEPKDRHRWFFSMSEAERLVSHFAAKKECDYKAMYMCHDRVPAALGRLNKNLFTREGCWILSRKTN